MKNLLQIVFTFLTITGFAQVGINTTMPNAQLYITSSNQATPSNTDGLLIPKVDVFTTTSLIAAQQGMQVYLTTADATHPIGFYYWDNPTSSWIGFSTGKNGWLTTGNAGNDPTVNFLGTTDLQPLRFKVNGINAGSINYTLQNSALGSRTLNSNISGTDNTADKVETLGFNSTWKENKAMGDFALYSNTTENDNTANRNRSLFSNKSGDNNVAFGQCAVYSLISGNTTICIGRGANLLYTNISNFRAICP